MKQEDEDREATYEDALPFILGGVAILIVGAVVLAIKNAL